MKTKLIVAAAFIISVFISCNKSSNKYETTDVTALVRTEPDELKSKDAEKQQIPVGGYGQVQTDSLAAPTPNAAPSHIAWDKKIIKTASLRLEIKDFKKYNSYVHGAARQYGGYIAQEEQNLSDEKSETAITIKVPVAQFENLMNQLPDDGSKVMERKINTDDVGGQIVDTRSRLEAKKEMRSKYLEFLRQSKNMTEVLQVQSEINDIQEQIESAAGRVAYLTNQSAMSTINLSFYQPLEGYKSSDAAPAFLTRIGHAFKNGTAWIAELFVGLVSIWPLLLITVAIYFGWRKLKPAKAIAQKP